jgi:hypothetical protein
MSINGPQNLNSFRQPLIRSKDVHQPDAPGPDFQTCEGFFAEGGCRTAGACRKYPSPGAQSKL